MHGWGWADRDIHLLQRKKNTQIWFDKTMEYKNRWPWKICLSLLVPDVERIDVGANELEKQRIEKSQEENISLAQKGSPRHLHLLRSSRENKVETQCLSLYLSKARIKDRRSEGKSLHTINMIWQLIGINLAHCLDIGTERFERFGTFDKCKLQQFTCFCAFLRIDR